jgi:acylphosphatase
MEEQHSIRLHAIIEGMVQGVGFRQYAVQKAQRLGLVGWVRNRYDRKVETIAEGPRDKLETFLQALNDGPPASFVRHVTATWEKATGEYRSFTIE